jgi:hypothetical protein
MFWRTSIAVLLAGSVSGSIEAQRAQLDPAAQRQAEQAQQRRQVEEGENLLYDQLRRGIAGPTATSGPPLDKETVERIKQFRKIDPEAVKEYSAFLKTHGTGVTKFSPDNGCRNDHVLSADDKCGSFVPQTYAFSFRGKTYTDDVYSDIAFKGNGMVAGSFFAQGAIIALGDKPIAGIDLENPAVKLLAEIPQDKDFDAARETAKRLKAGYSSDGLTVSTVVKRTVNTTYIARVIAYKMGTSVPAFSASSTPIEKRFLTLDLDSRGDIFFVFRIVDVKADGSVTVVWKVLDRKDVPKLRFAKGQPLSDFRP